MANKNLPPGWENRNPSAKPDWGAQKRELPEQERTDVQASSDSESLANPFKLQETISETPSSEISGKSAAILNNEKAEEIVTETQAPENVALSEQTANAVPENKDNSTEKMPKKSNAPFIVLIVLLVIAVIVLIVLVVLYFAEDKQEKANDSIYDNVPAIVTEAITTEISTEAAESITTASETTTTQTTTTETVTTTTTTTAAALLNENDYIGFWHMENYAESELTIHSIDSSTVTFSLWYYRLWSIENLTATLEGKSAYFYDDEIEGVLTFDDDSITLYVTMSNISGIPSQYEEIYSMRIDESVQYGNGMQYFDVPTTENPIGEGFALETTMYGQINCHGGIVAGYDSSYICGGGRKAAVRDSLGDTWHIQTWRGCYNYGIVWYECYDSDDGDYYGWVDSSYIDFYAHSDGR